MNYEAIGEIIAPVALKHGVKRISLFGSRARGDNREDSDYDFLISKGNVTTLWALAALMEDLENALHASVDVITDGVPDKKLLEEAGRDAVLLYEYKG